MSMGEVRADARVELYQVLLREPDMRRAARVNAHTGTLTHSRLHASNFTLEQAERYMALLREDNPAIEVKAVRA